MSRSFTRHSIAQQLLDCDALAGTKLRCSGKVKGHVNSLFSKGSWNRRQKITDEGLILPDDSILLGKLQNIGFHGLC